MFAINASEYDQLRQRLWDLLDKNILLMSGVRCETPPAWVLWARSCLEVAPGLTQADRAHIDLIDRSWREDPARFNAVYGEVHTFLEHVNRSHWWLLPLEKTPDGE